MATFGERLRASMDAHGALCVGIDPHPQLLQQWDLTVDADGLARFTEICVEAFAGRVGAVKPQSAFFEEYGSAGIAVLEKTIAAFREAGTPLILDVKRGDIGSTMAGYARAYLADGAPLASDAITVSPYLGFGSLTPALDQARESGRGLFVLALTSNPEGFEVQHAVRGDRSVAAGVVAGVTEANAEASARGILGSIGLVVGATVGTAVQDLGIDLAAANAPILAPGFGAQGAGPEDARRVFGAAIPNVLASSSREVLGVGPRVADLRGAADTARLH